MFFVFDSIPDQYKTQEICDSCFFISLCDEAVDDCLATLKLITENM